MLDFQGPQVQIYQQILNPTPSAQSFELRQMLQVVLYVPVCVSVCVCVFECVSVQSVYIYSTH